MKLGVVKTIDKQSLGGGLPAFVDPLISTLNQFMEQVVTALDRRLTFADNLAGKLIAYKFTSGVTAYFSPGNGASALLGMLVLDTGGGELASYQFTRESDGTVGIALTFVGGSAYNCKVFLLYG